MPGVGRVGVLFGHAPFERGPTRLESEIATAETVTNVVELHPQAVQRFKENIEALTDILTTKEGLPDENLVGTFRSLVERVVVHPRNQGEEYSVSIRGYLASLMGVEMSAVPLVAGVRVGRNSRNEPIVIPAIIELGTWKQSAVPVFCR